MATPWGLEDVKHQAKINKPKWNIQKSWRSKPYTIHGGYGRDIF